MASNSERETSADRPSAEAFQPLDKIDSTIPPINQQVIILPFPVPRECQNTPNHARTECAGKRKKCDKCGCQCMDKLTPPKPCPYCPICRKHYAGECWKATGGCYRCGEVGHHICNCPKPTRKSRKLARAQAEAAKISLLRRHLLKSQLK